MSLDLAEPILDLRTLSADQQAAQILASLRALPSGQALRLVHDQPLPATLPQALEAGLPGALRWQVLGDGPVQWQWQVARAGRDCCGACSCG